MTRVTGPVLLAEILEYLRTTATSRAALARVCGTSPGAVLNLRHVAFVTEEKTARLRAAMAQFPDGIAEDETARMPCEGARKPNPPVRPFGELIGNAAIMARARARSVAPARPSISDEMAREADAAAVRRAKARATGTVVSPLDLIRQPSAAERAASLCVETPGDLIATVKRRWPGQWARIVEASRAAGEMPGVVLARVIDAGLEEVAQ